MRVVLDGFWWVRGTQSLRHVVRGFTESWASQYPDDEIIIVVRRRHLDSIEDLPANVRAVPTRVWPQALLAMLVVPWVARQARADAMLGHNFTPLFGRRRSVLIQDVMFMTSPDWFSRKELVYYRWMVRSARRADIVFSSTETEALRIRRTTKARAVVRAGMGMSADLIDGVDDVPVDGLVPGKYILTVGRLNVRKNLRGTIEGVRESGRLSRSFPLVVVGERDGEWDELPAWVQDAIEDGSVVFTGFVSIGELRWLIRHCRVYVCLSLDEGFGLPPVEARILGARVLVSDLPVFHETLRQDATYVDPMNPDAIGTRLRDLLDEPAAVDPGAAGRIRRRHNWATTVQRVRATLVGEDLP